MKTIRLLAIMILLPLSSFALSEKALAHSINLAGKQRMLSQKMTKEALLIKSHINEEKNLKILLKSRNLFDKTLQGLQKGDRTLKLKVFRDKKIQEQLQVIQKKWEKFDQHIQQVLAKHSTEKTYQNILKENLPLLKELNRAVSLYVSLNQGKKSKRAQAVNLSGKERMLTQKIAKEILAISQHIDKKSNQQSLKKSKALFQKILLGLQHGDTSLKLTGTKLPKIKKQLKKVQRLWQSIRPALQSDFKNISKTKQTVQTLDTLLTEVDRAVKLFEKSIYREKQSHKLSFLVAQFMEKKNIQNHTINLAGKQRMLTQMMTKLAIQISLGINKEASKKALATYNALFERTLNGLYHGDTSLNLLACKNEKIKAHIRILQSLWKPFKNHIHTIITSSKDEKDALLYLVQNNQKLLVQSNQLVQQLKAKQTKQTFMEKARTDIVDIAGRERMLIQKMTKEKLLILTKSTFAPYKQKLQESISTFDSVLQKLIHGDKSKIVQPSNTRVLKQLNTVKKLWQMLKPLYQKEHLTKDELMYIIQKNPLLLKEMNQAVVLSETVADY